MTATQYHFHPDDPVSIPVSCPCCGEAWTIAVPYDGWRKFQNGLYVEDCFPNLPIEQRVLFTGGVCPMCVEF